MLPARSSTPFVVTDRWGYAPVGAYGKPELYDLAADPLATDNVAAGNEGIAADLHDLFMDHLSAHQASERFLALWRTPTLT